MERFRSPFAAVGDGQLDGIGTCAASPSRERRRGVPRREDALEASGAQQRPHGRPSARLVSMSSIIS